MAERKLFGVNRMENVLVWLLVIPTAAAIVCALLGPQRAGAVRWASLGATLVNLILAAALAISFAGPRLRAAPVANAPGSDSSPQTFEPPIAIRGDVLSFGRPTPEPESKPSSIQFYVGCDGLNIWLIVLTTLLMLSGVLVSWASIQERVNEFY